MFYVNEIQFSIKASNNSDRQDHFRLREVAESIKSSREGWLEDRDSVLSNVFAY